MFIELILRNWQLVLAGVLLVALGIAGVRISYLNNEVGKLEAEKQTLVAELNVANASIKSLQAMIDEQNKAIEKMKTDADAREKAAAEILARARADAKIFKKISDDLMKVQPAPGISKCVSAELLFNRELKNAK